MSLEVGELQIIITGKNIDLTDALSDHAREKAAKVGNLGVNVDEVEVRMVIEKNPSIKENQKAELTAVGSGVHLRATDRDRDMYVAIDKAVSKLQRQIKKYHGKRVDRTHGHHGSHREQPLPAELEEEEEEHPVIVKTKSISLKPMTPEEATLQMEMLGHDFFVFTDSETENASVVYRRNDGNYGLIDTSR
ncbi:MAG: ribosome-associated translation inhibitor RaiA [Actinobacteria bacterium]|nr:ribosome-associated translation inhibitor RaiA [Actinomycetota bacterium]